MPEPSLDTAIPVLIFKIGRYPLHHGTTGIVRSLGNCGVPVYAVVEDRFVPVVTSHYLTGAFVWSTLGLDSASLLAGLFEIAAKLGRPAILIPTDDNAAVFIAENGEILRAWYLFPSVPPTLPRRLANKKELFHLSKQFSIPCPDTSFPDSVEDVHAFIEHARFPVVVKSTEPQRTPAGLRSTSIARSPDELISIYRRATGPIDGHGTPRAGATDLILQEYIPESCAEDWIFHGYSNRERGCLASFTGRKLRSYPPFAGPTSLGVSSHNPALIAQSERLIESLGYVGIMDLDYRFDRRDGQYKLLDFNPRLGANFKMFEDSAGLDVVRALHLDLAGRAVVKRPCAERRIFMVESYDFFAALGYIQRRSLTVRGWWQSLQGARRYTAWFRLDDPFPFIMMCLRLMWIALIRLARFAVPGRSRRENSPVGDKIERSAVNV